MPPPLGLRGLHRNGAEGELRWPLQERRGGGILGQWVGQVGGEKDAGLGPEVMPDPSFVSRAAWSTTPAPLEVVS